MGFASFYTENTRKRKYLALLGGFLIHIVIGTVYITGNIGIYMASYLQYKNVDVTLNDLSIVLPLQVCGTSTGLLLGSTLTHKYNPWITVSIGNTILVISVFSTSFITSYAGIIIVYGLIYGIGVGITVIPKQYTTPLIVSWSHFPEYKGRISGIIISGFGFGSAIFNLVATGMINPGNAKPDHKIHGQKYFKSDIAERFPSVLRYLALIYLVLSVIGIMLLSRPTKKDEKLVDNKDIDECPSIKDGVKSKRFWFLFGMALMSITPGLYIMNVYKTFGKSQINNDQFLTIVGSVASVFNGSFRYLWGILMDKISFKKAYAILIATQTVFIMSMFYVAKVEALYLIWVCVIVCCEGGHFTIYPAVIARMYGKTMGSKVYSLLFYCFAIGAILGFLIQIFLTELIGYQGLFWTLGSISCLSLVSLYFFTEANIWFVPRQDTEIK